MPRNPDLSQSLAIVTGAGGGIGLEFAKCLALNRASLILIDINESRLIKARKEIEDLCKEDSLHQIYLFPLDLTSSNLIQRLDDFCHSKFLDPDILINNAGIFSFKPIADTSVNTIETFVNLHVRATTLLSRWFVDRRKKHNSGYLLNMSSMSCWMPMPGLALYASTKSYIRVFSRSLHYEMKDYKVGVTVACPGGIATDLFGLPEKWKKFAVAIGVLDTPSAFARKALKRMLKKKKQYINGFINRFSIFFIGILPTYARLMVKHHLLDKGITR